jgi:hypothetical protein
MANPIQSRHEDAMQRCIARCLECYRVCVEALRHGLLHGGPQADATHVRLLLDCIDICRTSADFMLRASDLHPRTCAVCAEVCQRCSDDCARFGDDPIMQRCAEVCRECAESCRQMAGEAVTSRAA